VKVFLSHSFSSEDRELVQAVERLLNSQDMVVTTGRHLAGGQLHPEIRNRIDNSDGLVALKTRRDRLVGPDENLWRSSPWIDYEYNHAREQDKHAIALVENGVEIDGGPFDGYERIALDREDPLEAFLALSETLWQWKERTGIRRVVQIRPNDLGRNFRINRNLKCRYRFTDREGHTGEWIDTKPVLPASGTLLYLTGVRDNDTYIEVQILQPQDENPRWYSPATPQFISVEMEEWEAGP
jgi:hypothetical protein